MFHNSVCILHLKIWGSWNILQVQLSRLVVTCIVGSKVITRCAIITSDDETSIQEISCKTFLQCLTSGKTMQAIVSTPRFRFLISLMGVQELGSVVSFMSTLGYSFVFLQSGCLMTSRALSLLTDQRTQWPNSGPSQSSRTCQLLMC
jgi:hypothetical protein